MVRPFCFGWDWVLSRLWSKVLSVKYSCVVLSVSKPFEAKIINFTVYCGKHVILELPIGIVIKAKSVPKTFTLECLPLLPFLLFQMTKARNERQEESFGI